jgi:predicted nuclease with TOPRIM domain
MAVVCVRNVDDTDVRTGRKRVKGDVTHRRACRHHLVNENENERECEETKEKLSQIRHRASREKERRRRFAKKEEDSKKNLCLEHFFLHSRIFFT